MKLKVGHWVSWQTNYCGVTVKKKGEIILILEPGENFYLAVEDLKKRYRFNIIHNKECVRDHLSYVVLMRDGDSISRLYWPKVESLRKVNKLRIQKVKKERKKKK